MTKTKIMVLNKFSACFILVSLLAPFTCCYASTSTAQSAGRIAQAKIPAGSSAVNPNEFNKLLNGGYKMLVSGQPNKAIELLSKSLRINPDSVLARRYLANALYQAGYYGEAAKQYKFVGELVKIKNGDITNDLTGMAASYYAASRFQEAIVAYRQLLILDPSSFNAQLGLAYCLMSTGQLEAAKALATQVSQKATGSLQKRLIETLMNKLAEDEKTGTPIDKPLELPEKVDPSLAG